MIQQNSREGERVTDKSLADPALAQTAATTATREEERETERAVPKEKVLDRTSSLLHEPEVGVWAA